MPNGLYEQIAEHENLCLAFHKAARGKAARREVQSYRENLQLNLSRLRRDLLKEQPQLGKYRHFTVFEPKRRLICAAAFPERLLHHAVMNVCESYFERFSILDSYACRKGKGLHLALQRAQFFARRYPWFLKLDIKKYFDTIDHQILLQLLKKRLGDKRVVAFFERLLSTYHTKHGKGMPIGNLISQHCANLYLGVFDHWVKDEMGQKGYLRYMDDFILFGQTKREMLGWREEVRLFLDAHLDLSLHPREIINHTGCGIPFLGMRVLTGRIKLSAFSKRRLVLKFRNYEKCYQEGNWSEDELARHMNSLLGFTLAGDCRALRNRVIKQYGVIK